MYTQARVLFASTALPFDYVLLGCARVRTHSEDILCSSLPQGFNVLLVVLLVVLQVLRLLLPRVLT